MTRYSSAAPLRWPGSNTGTLQRPAVGARPEKRVTCRLSPRASRMAERKTATGGVMALSAASGGGHMAAAEALVSAFRARGVQAAHVEILRYTTQLFRRVYADLYVELANHRPQVLGYIYRVTNRPWRYDKRRLALDRLNTRPLVRLLEQRNPAVALCTHFLPVDILLHLRQRKLLDIPVGVVITDFDAHAMWLYRGVDWYFVAHEEMKAHLAALGIPPGTVHVTGLPIDPRFAIPRSKADARVQMGLDPERATVLVAAGGFGMGPVESLVRAVDAVSHPIQVVVICGKNAALARRLNAVDDWRHTVRIVGFTTEMDSWMASADLVVGKPGGMTSSEAFARGAVLVIVNPIPGWEERNSDYFLEAGVAMRCNNLPTLPFKIDTLLADGERLARMREAVTRLARPAAASDIVSIVIGPRD